VVTFTHELPTGNRLDIKAQYVPSMDLVVRLRIEVADSPGSLAQVAAIIAEHGGNITAIDVQQGWPSSAVDEVTIEFAEAAKLAELRRHLTESGAARVLSHQTAIPVDLVVRVLRRLADVLPASDDERDQGLRRGIAELCSTPAVWVSPPAVAVRYAAGRLALERPGESALVRTSERLPPLAETKSGLAWLLAVANSAPGERQRVAFVARPLTQDFTATEMSRVEALMALHDQIETLRSETITIP
jgi:hypothetical protein